MQFCKQLMTYENADDLLLNLAEPTAFTVKYYREIIEHALMGTLADLRCLVENPRTPNIQRAIASVVYTAVENSDLDTLEKLVERVIGKIPDQIDVNVSRPLLADIGDKELKKRLARIRQQLEEDC
jgi:hypothetical protein